MNKKTATTTLSQLKNYLQSHQFPAEVAWWLLQAATEKSKSQLILEDPILSEADQSKLDLWLRQLIEQRKPLQYILGSTPFLNLTLTVQEPILIPRPETEEWVAWLIEQLKDISTRLRILDIGTGTGCIALALAQAMPHAEIIGTDINPKAIELAQRNAQRNNITNVTFMQSDLFDSLKDQRFHLIVSNPPYISNHEQPLMDASVYQWEDHQALFAADHGMALIKKIITRAPDFLIPLPIQKSNFPNLVLEIGFQQGHFVAQIMKASHYQHVVVYPDGAGKDRIVVGSIDHEKVEP